MKNISLVNGLKASLLYASAVLAFVLLISVFPLFGALFTPELDILQILKDNFSLLIPSLIILIPAGFIIGFFSAKINTYKLLKLNLFCIPVYFLIIILSLLFFTSNINKSDILMFALLVAWAAAAYFIIAAPLIFLANFLFAKWSSKKND